MEKGIRSCAFFCAMILLICLLIGILPTEAEAKIYSDTLRLHILAESDGDNDQRTKLLLRDFILKEYGEYLGEAKSKADAAELISKMLSDIETRANGYLKSIGCDAYATVSLGEEWFDTRVYEEYTLPEGYYQSLIIKIGEGEGKNWWCVMYPPMCLGVSSKGYSCEEEKLITEGKRNIKFKMLEVLSRVFK